MTQATATVERTRSRLSGTRNNFAHRVGPHSRPKPIAEVDLRTKEGKFLQAYEKMLVRHVGGDPSITQWALITRTARLALHCELLDAQALKDGKGLTVTSQHFYCVWTNSLARHLAKLGFEPHKAKAAKPSLSKVMAEMAK